jgi:hypothetical protein
MIIIIVQGIDDSYTMTILRGSLQSFYNHNERVTFGA